MWVNPQGRLTESNASPMQQALEDALKYEGEQLRHCVGGYCPAVVEGKSRIYSLRDAEGQPKVTIEVQPPQRSTKVETDWFTAQPESVQDEITAEALAKHEAASAASMSKPEERRFWGDVLSEAIQKRMGPVPPKIVQVKGFKNQKPPDEFMPEIQDFIRSGQWSGVGDLQNTGLVEYTPRLQHIPRGLTGVVPRFDEAGIAPGYYTEDELRGLLEAAQRKSARPGFARGGAVNAPAAVGIAAYNPAHIEALTEMILAAQA